MAENLVIGGGVFGTGHGWSIAPPIIHMLVEWEYSGKKTVLLQPFGLERFMRFKS